MMVSSGMGSISITSDPERVESGIIGLPYPSSKTALNMITSQYAKALPEFRINAADPGYTATDLNGHNGYQSVTEGTDAIVSLAGCDGRPHRRVLRPSWPGPLVITARAGTEPARTA